MIELIKQILVYYNIKTNDILLLEFIDYNIGFDPQVAINIFNEINNIKDNSTQVTWFNQSDYPELLIPEIKHTVTYDRTNNKLLVDLDLNEEQNANAFYWNKQNPHRNFNQEEVENLYYNHYINCNLYNVLTSNNDIEVQFIPLNKLILDPLTLSKDWQTYFSDPFLDEYNNDKLALGKDIITRGTYFPCMVFLDYDMQNYLVREGNHRIASLKLCQAMHLIDDDFEVCCIILPRNLYYNMQTILYNHTLQHQFQSRYVLECYWTPEVLVNEKYEQTVKNNLLKTNCKLINNYIVEQTITTCRGLFESIHTFPLFLRDLFYLYKDINPAKIFNNKEEFFKWLGDNHVSEN